MQELNKTVKTDGSEEALESKQQICLHQQGNRKVIGKGLIRYLYSSGSPKKGEQKFRRAKAKKGRTSIASSEYEPRRDLKLQKMTKNFTLLLKKDFTVQEDDVRKIREIENSRNMIKMFPTLKTLRINTTCNWLATDQHLSSLCNSFRYLRDLNTLDFILGWYTEFTEKGVINLIRSLRFFDDSLQNLSFGLQGSKGLTKKAFITFGPSLRSLKSLQRIVLDMNCTKIQDEELMHLSKILGSIQSLKSIRISLELCFRLSNQALLDISSNLESLPLLQDIDLNFKQNDGLTDELLPPLGANFRAIKSLQNITLGFLYCNRLTELGLLNLLITLQSIPSIKKSDN